MLSTVVGCKHSHLWTAIPGSWQQVLLGISNSVWVCFCRWDRSPGGAVSKWPFLQSPFFVPAFPLDRRDSGLKFLKWVGGPIPQLGAMPIHWIWSLQVLSPLCWVFRLMSSQAFNVLELGRYLTSNLLPDPSP